MRLFILTILVLTNVLLNAQNTFSKTFYDSILPWRNASAQSRNIVEISGGYLFAFAGSSLSLQQGSFLSLIKTNSLGEEVWRRENQSFEFRYTVGEIGLDNDSNIYVYYTRDTSATSITGRVGIVMLEKYNLNGELIWQKPYYNEIAPYNVRPTSISLLNDLIYLTGVSIDLELTTQSISYYNTALYCINQQSGELLWIKSFDTGSKDDYNNDLLISDDGHIYLSGLTNGLGASGLRGHLIKTNMQGNMIWQKLFNDIVGIMTINSLENSNFILTGINPSQPNTNGRIIEIDTSGQRINTNNFTFIESLDFYRSSQISDGNLVTVGLTNMNPNANNCGLIQKSKPTGELLWRHRYDYGPNSDFFTNFVETEDNHLLVIGATFVDFNTGQDAWLLKLDSNGCLIPGCLLSVNEVEPEIGISVYPNPTQDRLYIKTEQSQKKPLLMSLYDMQGKLIIQEKLVAEYESFDLKSLSTGVYLLNIVDGDGKRVSKRIIKN